MTIAFTALSGSRFWSRHVLLSGPKLQNTNCTDTFSTAVTRHKQQTSGRLPTVNYTIVKCFFQIHAPGKCFISHVQVLVVCVPLTTQAAKFSWAKNISSDLPFATIQQIFCLSSLLLMRIWCQFFPSWIPFEHCNFSLSYSHIVPLNQIEVTSETWTSIVYNLLVSEASGVM